MAQEAMEAQAARATNGARWFYWIAGLSLVNSLLMLAGQDVVMVVGLALTLVPAVILGGAGMLGQIVAMLFTLLATGLFVLMGWQASKGRDWAFIAGAVVYGLDAIVFALFADWLAFAFHGFALTQIVAGYLALRRMRTAVAFPQASETPEYEAPAAEVMAEESTA